MAYMRDSAGRRLDARPSADLVRPNTIALLGDSITYFNGYGIGIYDPPFDPPTPLSQGYFIWANASLGGRLRLLRCAGVGGETTAQVLARVTDITELPELPGFCVVEAGSNDFLQSIPSATAIANLQAIIDALHTKGITVVLCTLPGVWSNNATILASQYEINDWIRRQSDQPGVIVCNWTPHFQQPNGTPQTGLSTDGVHPTILGAAALGKALADAMRPHIGGSIDLISSNQDTTNALLNGMMIGTTGVLNTGSAGQLATSWNAGRTAGTGTITCSKVTPRSDAISGEWQALSIAGGPGTFAVWQDVTPTLAAGQTWYAEMEYDSLVPTAITKFTLTASVFTGGSGGAYSSREGAPDTMLYSATVPAGVLRTPPFVVTGTPTTARVSLDIIGNGSVRVSRIRLRRAS